MSRPDLIRPLCGLLLLGALGCGDAPDGEGEGWPLSEIESSALADSAGSDPVDPKGPRGEAGDLAAASDSGAVGPDGTPERPAMDAEASGPMIHPEARFPGQPPLPEDFPDARFPRPDDIRGLYLNAWSAGSSRRMEALLDVARRTEVNAFVIDIKDATGYLSHRSEIELAREIGATGEIRIRDLPGLLDRLEEEGIYPIARIVVVKDPLLSAARPDLAVQDTAGGVWIDSKEIIWLNPFSEEVWDYHLSIATEVAEMGFPEIQWDYIRFPDAPASDMDRAIFTGSGGRLRVEAIRGFLGHARDELAKVPARSTADVFGVTTSFNRDVGIGQLWESFIDVVDTALPMIYPSHYWPGSFGYRDPNGRPYEVVKAALRSALRRSSRIESAGRTRPWLQDFTLGMPIYGAPEVRAQIQATYDAGVNEWILWNPSSRYSEAALEPVGGFEFEPLIRVAGLLAPVSRRQAVIDSIAALPAPESATPRSATADSTDEAADSLATPDTTAVDDTVGVDAAPVGATDPAAVDSRPAPPDTAVDSLAVRPDTAAIARPVQSFPKPRR